MRVAFQHHIISPFIGSLAHWLIGKSGNYTSPGNPMHCSRAQGQLGGGGGEGSHPAADHFANYTVIVRDNSGYKNDRMFGNSSGGERARQGRPNDQLCLARISYPIFIINATFPCAPPPPSSTNEALCVEPNSLSTEQGGQGRRKHLSIQACFGFWAK